MDEQRVRDLEAHGIRFVRVVWCDNARLRRAKAVHIQALPAHLAHGVGISAGQLAVPALYDAVVPGAGLGPVGEVRLVPDWPTLAEAEALRGQDLAAEVRLLWERY
jgi:glutamine synthetase